MFRPAAQPDSHLNLILLDTSGSNLNHRALSQALGAISGLYRRAYLQRQRCALLGFGNGKVDILLKPQRAHKQLEQRLNIIQAGGGTPLRQALLDAQKLLRKNRRQHPAESQTLYLFTDGRSRDELDDIAFDCPVVVVDTERTAVRLGRARQLAQRFGGACLALER